MLRVCDHVSVRFFRYYFWDTISGPEIVSLDQRWYLLDRNSIWARRSISGPEIEKNCVRGQWRRQLWGTGARAPPPRSLTSNNCIFSSLWSKSENQLSNFCVVCEISWCKCQQLTAFLISTALVTKLLAIEQLLHPALKSTVSVHDIISSFASPRNKSWRRHCSWLTDWRWAKKIVM